MKLATLDDGSRDGQLVVVARDLRHAHYATAIATRLQQVLDDWNFLSPQLEELARALDAGRARHAFEFDPRRCLAPLPRAPQWVHGSSLNPLELARKPRNAALPAGFAVEPPMSQRASDDLQGACADARIADEAWGIDFGAGVAVVTGDVEIGVSPETALESVRLVLLVNDWSLRERIAAELAQGCGVVQGKPAAAFGPVAVTPDELGDAWRDGRVHLPLELRRNGSPFGRCEDGAGMSLHFGELIAHVATTRRLRAGSIVGSGTAGNPDASDGCCSIAEARAIETIRSGTPATAYLRFGDTVRIEMRDRDGRSVFGAIEQRVVGLGG